MSPCLCGAIDCPSCGGSAYALSACEDCGADGVALADYYALSPYPQEPLWLCGGCEQERAEAAWEARTADFYGGDSPTEAEAMEAARRLK